MNQTNNITTPGPVGPNYVRKGRGGAFLTGIIIGILILALIFCGVTIIKTRSQTNKLSKEVVSQQQAMDALSDTVQSANSLNEQLQSDNSALQSDVAAKDETISSYEGTVSKYKDKVDKYKDKVTSYKDQLHDLTSRYNDLVGTSGSGKKPGVSKYATIAVTNKTCYLTFDDGPSDNTLKILKILKQYNVKATFFVMATSKISYVKKIHKEGHTVALHTYSHNYADLYRSQKAYFNDLEKIGKLVKKYTGTDARVIRFPGGSSNTISRDYCKGIMTALSKEVLNQGYVYYDWNVDSTDASGNNVSVSRILYNIKTYGGHNKQDVILMHDTDAKDTTVQALPQIIEYYIDQGYTFAPITTATPQVKHGINN